MLYDVVCVTNLKGKNVSYIPYPLAQRISFRIIFNKLFPEIDEPIVVTMVNDSLCGDYGKEWYELPSEYSYIDEFDSYNPGLLKSLGYEKLYRIKDTSIFVLVAKDGVVEIFCHYDDIEVL